MILRDGSANLVDKIHLICKTELNYGDIERSP